MSNANVQGEGKLPSPSLAELQPAWPLGKWLLLNFNYHVVHHLHPGVHWSKLGEAHEIMRRLDPSIADMHSEWEVNVGLRRQSLRDAFAKYLDYQFSQQ